MVLKNSGRWEVCIKTDGRWEVGLKTDERWEVGLKNRWEVGGWPKKIGGSWDFEVRCAKDSNIITQLSMWVHCPGVGDLPPPRSFAPRSFAPRSFAPPVICPLGLLPPFSFI